VHRGISMEKAFPWRVGPAVVFRIPLTQRGIAVGYWNGQQDIDTDAFGESLLKLRPMDVEDWEKF
jgi:hypothetical protein